MSTVDKELGDWMAMLTDTKRLEIAMQMLSALTREVCSKDARIEKLRKALKLYEHISAEPENSWSKFSAAAEALSKDDKDATI